MNNKKLKLTVGIPTCYSGESLYQTLKSLRASKGVGSFELIVVADRTPISKNLRERIEKLGVKLIWNNVEGSQCKKLKQIIEKATGDIFIFTQDDIIFDPKTLSEIKKAFENDPKLTMVGVKVLTLKSASFFEGVMGEILRVVDRIATKWNKGNNYLMANGRCLAFRTSFLRKFRITDSLINTDAFLYFENKQLKGRFKALNEAKVYIRTPQNINDQIGPSSRFQYSQLELSKYFKSDLSKYYKIPLNVLVSAAFKEFLSNPLQFSLYVFIYIYARLKKQSKEKALKTLWKIDQSTKLR